MIRCDNQKTLKELVDNRLCDKNTAHSYLDAYEDLFQRRRESASNVLEIGVQDGGSIKLWRAYFSNATIHGMDLSMDRATANLAKLDRIVLYTADAYAPETIEQMKQRKYDVIIDDGPHTKESMLEFARNYADMLTDDGILVVEDIQSETWVPEIIAALPAHLQSRARVIDLRGNKGRYDDLIIVVDLK
jgi:cephalosporin hydroxylase